MEEETLLLDDGSDDGLLDYLLEEDVEPPCLDIDDIELDVTPPVPEVADAEAPVRPSEVILSDILRRGETGGNGWTHLVRSPGPFRCSITDHAAAGELYRSVWRYAESGMSVMERRLSPITRCSLSLRLSPGHMPSSRLAEREFVRLAVKTVVDDLRDALRTQVSPAALFCLVLRPRGSHRTPSRTAADGVRLRSHPWLLQGSVAGDPRKSDPGHMVALARHRRVEL
jgi:hypothetical protein